MKELESSFFGWLKNINRERNDKNVLLKLSNYISNYNFEIFIICVIIPNQTRGIL